MIYINLKSQNICNIIDWYYGKRRDVKTVKAKKHLAGLTASCMILTMLFGGAASADSVTVTADRLNIRKEASASSKAVGVVDQNETLSFVSESGDWFQVRTGSKEGFVSKEFVALDMSQLEADVEANTEAMSASGRTTDRLNMRALPMTKADIVKVIPKNSDRVDIAEINEQYLSEFLEALTSAINRMSADGIRISHVSGKARELSQYMANELDESWRSARGFEVQSVGIASVSYDDESKELINMRNKGAMLSDPTVREGYVQGAVARGFEAAGSNSAGSATAFMGMGMGMNAGGGFMGAASETNRREMDRAREEAAKDGWTCSCGATSNGNFCSACGKKKPAPAGSWKCSCGIDCMGNFCASCGSKKPADEWFCTECGHKNAAEARFCNN